MKKRILLASAACSFLFASVMMSCGGSHEEKPAADSTHTSQTTTTPTTPATTEATANAEATATTTATTAMYACEMKCEGEGVSHNEAGKCPKCGMEMKQLPATK